MTVTENDHAGDVALQESPEEPSIGQSKASVSASETSYCHTATDWEVQICLGERLITRKAYHPGSHVNSDIEGKEREDVIWPAWPATTTEEAAVAGIPLADLQEYWSKAGNRLRDSAKWMATVLGAAIAAVIGTAPLSSLRYHHLQLTAALIGLAGLVLLAITMLLVLQVMRPEAVSYEDVQTAGPLPDSARALPKRLRQHGPLSRALETPLYRWQETVKSNQDLYLPCGVTSLGDLRESMAIEEKTLVTLARVAETITDRTARKRLSRAQAARAVRLLELRTAAAHVAIVGEYYALRSRSTRATYGGIACGFLGTAAIVLAFMWPVT